MHYTRQLSLGHRGDDVRHWQGFLTSLGHYRYRIDRKFGNGTLRGTKKFQKQSGLEQSGVVDEPTLRAARLAGLRTSVAEPFASRKWLKTLKPRDRQRVFGPLKWEERPTAREPGGIKILGDWERRNMTRVLIPSLGDVKGAPKSCRVYVHRKIELQLVALFEAWAGAGLSSLILTWHGSFNARFTRRSSSRRLSSHSFGTAFDINAQWNAYHHEPAAEGQTGSVRELVPLAEEFAFAWGGDFDDGMHFEAVEALSPAEVASRLKKCSEAQRGNVSTAYKCLAFANV
jgi:hypothetical protein